MAHTTAQAAARILAIGDIHGCSHALDLVLEASGFGAGDILVTLGDYVDRGPDSRGVIERLIEIQGSGQLVALRGNHEIMMQNARDDYQQERFWREVGGEATLASYGGIMDDVPMRHWDFLDATLPFWESRTHFFVHAGAYPDAPLDEQPDYKLFWERFDWPALHSSGKIMVCGHTSQKSGLPLRTESAICLDTWAVGKGWLSCLDVASGRLWQAQQKGATRVLWIDDV